MTNKKVYNFMELMGMNLVLLFGVLEQFLTAIRRNLEQSGIVQEICKSQDLDRDYDGAEQGVYNFVLLYLSMLALHATASGRELTPQYMVAFWDENHLSDDGASFTNLFTQLDFEPVPGCNMDLVKDYLAVIRACYWAIGKSSFDMEFADKVKHGLYTILRESLENC